MTDTSGQAGMQIDSDLVRQLAELLDSTRLTEIEVQDGDRRIRVVRNIAMPAAAAAPASIAAPAAAIAPVAEAPAVAAPPAVDDPAKHPGVVRSPMVGTAYMSSAPTAAPFVTVGARVRAGETLLIIEAMKVMNPIAAPRDGIVKRILVASGQPVEYDMPLAILE